MLSRVRCLIIFLLGDIKECKNWDRVYANDKICLLSCLDACFAATSQFSTWCGNAGYISKVVVTDVNVQYVTAQHLLFVKANIDQLDSNSHWAKIQEYYQEIFGSNIINAIILIESTKL